MKHLILYAEDDRATADLYLDDLCDGGFEVIWAKNGSEAVRLYKKYTPSLLLLDIEMPELNGYQVAEEIRRKDLYTPIIFLTSYSDAKSAVKGFDSGANDFIRKEVEADELLARINTAILRNPVKHDSVLYITQDTFFNRTDNTLHSLNESQKLSEKESNLLQILFLNKNIPQNRELVIKQVWGNNSKGADYMSKTITLLRKVMSNDQRIKLVSSRSDSIALMVDE